MDEKHVLTLPQGRVRVVSQYQEGQAPAVVQVVLEEQGVHIERPAPKNPIGVALTVARILMEHGFALEDLRYLRLPPQSLPCGYSSWMCEIDGMYDRVYGSPILSENYLVPEYALAYGIGWYCVLSWSLSLPEARHTSFLVLHPELSHKDSGFSKLGPVRAIAPIWLKNTDLYEPELAIRPGKHRVLAGIAIAHSEEAARELPQSIEKYGHHIANRGYVVAIYRHELETENGTPTTTRQQIHPYFGVWGHQPSAQDLHHVESFLQYALAQELAIENPHGYARRFIERLKELYPNLEEAV